MSDGRSEHAGPQSSTQVSGVKVLETLKKHIFEHGDSSSKSLSSREVCSSFSDLTAAVFSTTQRANSSIIVSGAIELLVHACSSQDRAISLAGQENLHKLIKGLQYTHLSRLQQDLFHELKKNGSARSLTIALEIFAELFPSTRPSRRQSLTQSLLPVLLRLLAREEELLHETLQDSLSLILPTMSPFLSITNTQLLMSALLERLPDSIASYRRMTASTLHHLIKYSTASSTHTQWLVRKMLGFGCHDNATDQLCLGILLTLQNMASCHSNFTLDLLKQVYGFILSCMLYRDTNTAVAAMETMNAILNSSSIALTHWLMTSQPSATMATQYWLPVQRLNDDGKEEEEREGVRGETHSLGEGIRDGYFDLDPESLPLATTPASDPPVTSEPKPLQFGCLATTDDGINQPLPSLVKYLQDVVLPSNRVSIVSVGLACLTSCADLVPSLISSLSHYLPFTSHSDPKLKSRTAMLLAVIVRAVLRESDGQVTIMSLVSDAATYLHTLLNDESSVVLKAVCESLRVCLPSLATSSQPQLAVTLVQSLLTAASSSSYWLAKVELLRTLSCLPLTALALSLPSLPNSLLTLCVFPLLGDTDHRVRTAAAEAMSILVQSLQLTSHPVLAHAHWEVSREFPSLHIHNPQLSLASAGLHGNKTIPPTPLGLQHMLWFLVNNISSSTSHSLQRGCLEALHTLCIVFPPASLPESWGCHYHIPSLLPISLSLLTSSHLAWTVHGQQLLLDVCSSLFLACSLSTMITIAQSGQHTHTSSSSWSALGTTDLVAHANLLLRHVARLLAVFVHVIENREPEIRDTRRAQVISPMKSPGREASPVRSTPTKPKVQIIENLQKPPLVPRDGIGQFASLHHYLKIMDACRSAYTNYQVSLAGVGDDKFSRLLQSTHNLATIILEVALASDVGKHVEELMTYFTHTFKVDPSGALLCVQQLLNSLFGMNVAAQHSSIHSPYLSSLSYELYSLQKKTTTPHSTDSITQVTITQPLKSLEAWLEGPPPHLQLSPSNTSPVLPRKRSFFPSRRALVVKPVNSVSSVRDYIAHFEPLVVSVVKRFPHTSSYLLQQRTLYLLVQLLQLKVRYELLDCNHTFLDSVLKLVGLMESGVVRDGQDLIPYLFQFLVLLAYDNSKAISIPQVMQKCDGVMASGHSVDTFAIPALQPLVLNLFVRPSKEGPELETQREVVLSMLLRVVDHPRVISLLTHVLDCFSHSSKHWHRVSSQILASILNAVARLSLVLDNAESMATLYHLFSAMDPSAISIKALFVALLKQSVLNDVQQLCRWLAIFNNALTLMANLFPDITIYSDLSSLSLAVPGIDCEMVKVEGHPPCHSEPTSTRIAWFILGVLRVAAETENRISCQAIPHPQPLLPQLLAHCLLLLNTLITGSYRSLCTAFSSMEYPSSLATVFLSLSVSYPLLTLHYCQFCLHTNGVSWVLSVLNRYSDYTAPSHLLIYHCLLPLVTSSTHSTLASGADKQQVIDELMKNDMTSLVTCMKALHVVGDNGSIFTLKLLCKHLVCHPLSAISSPALDLAQKIINNNDVSGELACDLLAILSHHDNNKCSSKLISQLQSYREPNIISQPHPLTPSHPLQSTLSIQTVTKLWYLSEVYELCMLTSEWWLCGRVLARLSISELNDLLNSKDFKKGLLEVCVCHGLDITLATVTSSSQGLTHHPLLQCSSSILKQRITEDPNDCSLISALLWLLISQQLLSSSPLDEQTCRAVLSIILSGLQHAKSTLSYQTVLDVLSLALALSEIQTIIDTDWVGHIVPLVATLLDDNETTYYDPCHQLHSALSICLTMKLTPPLGLHIHTALLSLARLPSLHTSTLTPPLILPSSSDHLSELVLDRALLEGEVLQQYMTRSNCVGWLTRSQFEERWMQLLGVVNQPPPQDGMPIEEVYAHILNMSVGIVGVVSLLLATSMRPEPGNPVSGVAMHTHRNRDILFLGTKPGRRLSTVRSMIEKHIITQCGNRANIYSHYQYPLLAHLSFPLYTRNIERGSGDSDLGPGQLSLKSLWPVTLLGPTTSTARYTQEGVDVRSCILSLVDLFSHWLSQPLHTLLLLQTLRAILMLSDLFSLATQFDWMLQLSSDLSDKQPLEDDSIYSLLIHCLLKAAAVVKVDGQQQVEKIVKLTEKALTSDSLHVQNGCLCGLLYVAEDSTSQLAIHLGPLLVKYLPPQLEAFHRNTERHCHLCWSLAVSLSLNHSHLLKDAEFPGQLLDKAIPLLLHPHTSSLLFHSICLGLELMVVNFTFTTEQRAKVTGIAASRCSKCDLDKLLPALGLLVSCMYTLMYSGEQASNENEKTENEMSIQTREHVSVLMEHLRHGPLEGVIFLVDLIPVLITDFFPPVQVLQMVVTEFVSPHQPRPTLAAVVMGETLSLLLSRNMGELVTDWVLLSLDSFVQQEPENKAVWCLVCLLTAASSSSILRAMLEVVAAQPDMPLPHSCALLATASSHFYSSQANNQQQLLFVEKFLSSSYSTLNTVAHACLHS